MVSALVFVVFRYLSLCYKGIFWDQWQLNKMLQVQVSLQLSPLAQPTFNKPVKRRLEKFSMDFLFWAFEF